jgi:hypothetical protein
VLALAREHEEEIAADLARLWASPAPAEEAVEALGERVLASPGPALARARLAREVEVAARAFGPWLHGPAGEDLSAWGAALLGRAS